MDKRQIVCGVFLPPNKQAAKTIHPGMCTFHYPPTCFEASFPFDCPGLFSTRAYMSRKAKCLQDGIDLIVIVPFVQAHPLWVLRAWDLGARPPGSRWSRAPASYHAD